MPVVETTVESDLPPDRVRAALVSFGPDRPKTWPGITPELYEVYSVGETEAEVKEGTRMPLVGDFWARERYDWSDAKTVRWTVLESNFCEPGSFVSATIEPKPGGGSSILLHWERTLTKPISKVMGRMIVLTRGKLFADSFRKGLATLR